MKIHYIRNNKIYIYLKKIYISITSKPPCILCNGSTKIRNAYGRYFFHCKTCNFIFTSDYNKKTVEKGMGMAGSWTGPGGGGYREYYLVKMLEKALNLQSFLLFGTGNTDTFAKLIKEGVDVVGCDISQEVVDYKKANFGNNSFFTPDSLPKDKIFDGIIAVEVFEHFTDPKSSFNLLMNHLKPNGIICGTTNFYLGGPIEDDNNPGYMSLGGHVSYWSLASMKCIASHHDCSVSAFELIRPGSVLPDEKYGQLWPNKRVFFIYNPNVHITYFENLLKTTPILPIDKP